MMYPYEHYQDEAENLPVDAEILPPENSGDLGDMGDGAQEGALRRADRAARRASKFAQMQAGMGAAMINRSQSIFGPLERKAVFEAMRSPDYLVDQAATDTRFSHGRAIGAVMRNLSRMGINPNSGRYAGVKAKMELARAAAEAGARTRARRVAEDSAFMKLIQALGYGQSGRSLGASMMSGGVGAMGGVPGQFAGIGAARGEDDAAKGQLAGLLGRTLPANRGQKIRRLGDWGGGPGYRKAGDWGGGPGYDSLGQPSALGSRMGAPMNQLVSPGAAIPEGKEIPGEGYLDSLVMPDMDLGPVYS